MNECFGKNFILNGVLQPAEIFDNSLVYEGESVYEVIRLVKGIPVFFNDHFERLSASAKLTGKERLADDHNLRKAISDITRSDRKKEINLKIVYNYNDGKNTFLAYYIESVYPSVEQYAKGVKGVLFFAERKEPESKVINHKLRSSVYHKLINEGAYEALLVNENNLITEGSRSNIFFLKEETLVTAPDSTVLNGVTRKHILDICSKNRIPVEFYSVNADEISGFDAVFMTGTSPKVLPFCCLGNVVFNVKHPLINRLRQLYMLKVDESISLFRNE